MGKTKTDKFFDKLTLADDFVFKMVHRYASFGCSRERTGKTRAVG